MRQVSDWLMHWTVAAGIEGVVTKQLGSRYQPGRRGWRKFRTRITTEAIIGGVTGSLRNPDTLLLGRFDRRGRLRYTGRTHPLDAYQRQELTTLLSPLRPLQQRRAAVVHPWPEPLPASWSGQLDRAGPAAVRAGRADGGGGDRGGRGLRAPKVAPPSQSHACAAGHVGV